MDAQRWQEIKSTFDTIVEMDVVERESRLTALNSSDPELRAAVELLLTADSDADARLASLDAVFFPQSAPTSDPLGLAGQTISHFQIRESIGAGGMGVVYRAEDVRLGRPVALKFLLPSHSLDARAKARFLREAHLVAALDHPNLCTIHDVGTSDDGRVFLAMPLYQGETLKSRITRNGAVPIGDAVEIARQVTQGLQCAHGAGIVHRDLKPGNVMLLKDGTVKILDFGLAKAHDESLSEPGARFGTVSYMSPEQIHGETANERADLWAVGVILYEMLTERKPFGGEQDISIAHAILHDEPVPISTYRRDVSAALEDLVHRLLQKDASKRYATAAELLGELAGIDTTVQRMPHRPSARSRRWVPIAIGGGVAAAAIGAAFILARKPPPPPPPDRVQLTFTGISTAASLSPDGTRLAFGEKLCDEAGSCTYQVVIQDTDGSNRLVVSRNSAHVYRTAWTRDGRYLVYDAEYGPARWGIWLISTLGGAPRHLGSGRFDLLSGDTILMAGGLLLGDSIGWVRRITAHDGQTLDSIPVRAPGTVTPGYGFDVTHLTYPNRLIVTVRKTFESAPELRLIDFRGAIIDRVTPGFASLGRLVWSRWVPSKQKLIVAYERALSSLELDIVSMDVTPSGFRPHVDTVLSRLQTADGIFDISPDGERLVHSPGSVETTVWAIDPRRTNEGRLAATQVLSSTTLLRGLISPAGDRIVVVREIPTSDGRASNFSILPRDGGAESQIARGIRNLLDFEWSPDGATIMYLHGIGGNQISLMESDTMGRRTREIARLRQSAAIAFHPLPDGALCLIPPERRSLSIIRRPGKRDVTWRAPDWISSIANVSLSPDTRSLAVLATDGVSAIVATVDIENGRFTKLAILGAEWLGGIRWLDDGNIMFDVRETQGDYTVYTTRPGGATRRLGAVPYTQEMSSVSKDGVHMAGFNLTFKNDVYMIRNFGKMLRR
jgi:serine/threonine protein kinase/Tol biopolymer transport system component